MNNEDLEGARKAGTLTWAGAMECYWYEPSGMSLLMKVGEIG